MSIASDRLGPVHEARLPTATVRYRERGRGRPIVFVHGLLVDGDLWRKVVPDLADDFRCLTPDWPLGAHAVPLPPGADASVLGVARLIADFLAALDLRDVVLVANDTGGALTQIVMTRWPERVGAVVLTPCDCFDNFLPPLFRPLQALARTPRLLTAVLQGLRLPALRRLPMVLGWLARRPIERAVEDAWAAALLDSPEVRRDAYSVLRSISPALTLEAADALPKFERPVLLAWAAEDRFFPLEHAHRLAARLPDARVVPIADSYSFVSEDRPEALVAAVREFLGVRGD